MKIEIINNSGETSSTNSPLEDIFESRSKKVDYCLGYVKSFDSRTMLKDSYPFKEYERCLKYLGKYFNEDNGDKYDLPLGKPLNYKGNFTQIGNEFIDSTELSIYEKIIFIIIKRHIIKHDYCFPSLKTIARKAGCSVTTVKKSLNSLIAKGIIEKFRRSSIKSNNYKIINEKYPVNSTPANGP